MKMEKNSDYNYHDICNEHKKIGDVYFDIANRNFKQKKLMEAEFNYNNALDSYIKSFGYKQQCVVLTYYNLAIISLINKKVDEEIKYNKKVMEIAKLIYGDLINDHTESAIIVLQRAAKVFFKYGYVKDSEKFYNKALEVYGKIKLMNVKEKEWSNLGLLIDINYGLAILYQQNNLYNEALKCYKLIIDVRKDLGQEWRRDLYSIYLSVGDIYNKKEMFLKSSSFYEQGLKILSRKNQKDKKTLVELCIKIGDSYLNIKIFDNATVYYKLAFDISSEIGKEFNLDVCKYIISKTKTYNIENTKKYLKEEVRICKEIMIRKQLNISYEFEKLANSYFNDGIKDEAVNLFKKSFNIRSKLLSKNDYENALLMYNIATLYTEHKIDEAEKLFKKAILMWENVIGENSDEVAKAYNNLGVFYVNVGKTIEAEKYLSKALDIRKIINNGIENDTSINLKLNLGNVYLKMNKFELAENLYQYILNYHIKNYGENSKKTADLLYNFGILYKKQNKIDIAVRYLKKALASYNSLTKCDESIIDNITKFIRKYKKNI